ncbi:hypothetical protein HDU67_010250 [Dinochytrium kinnereticum]|nr:hypothetical protein HDU67_010250 [Dinochytrium kinnereticum]
MLAATSLFTTSEGDALKRPAAAPSPTPPDQIPQTFLTSLTEATTSYYRFLLGWFRAAAKPLTPSDTLTTSIHSPDATWSTRRATVTGSSRAGRSVVLCPPMSLSGIKRIKNAVGGATVNDVMAAAIAGAFRRYLLEFEEGFTSGVSGDPFDGVRMRALMPFGLGLKGGGGELDLDLEDDEVLADALHNNWSMVSVPLLVSISDPLERVTRTAEATSSIKSTPEASATLTLQKTMATLFGDDAQSKMVVDVFAGHTCVFSNVPGMGEPVYVAMEKVLDIQFVVPNMVHQVNMTSYDGRIYCNFCTSDALIKHPGALKQYLLTELEVMAESPSF